MIVIHADWNFDLSRSLVSGPKRNFLEHLQYCYSKIARDARARHWRGGKDAALGRAGRLRRHRQHVRPTQGSIRGWGIQNWRGNCRSGYQNESIAGWYKSAFFVWFFFNPMFSFYLFPLSYDLLQHFRLNSSWRNVMSPASWWRKNVTAATWEKRRHMILCLKVCEFLNSLCIKLIKLCEHDCIEFISIVFTLRQRNRDSASRWMRCLVQNIGIGTQDSLSHKGRLPSEILRPEADDQNNRWSNTNAG